MKIMISGEDREAAETLGGLAEKESEAELCASAGDVDELMRLAEELSPDAVFIEAEMHGLSGLQAARALAGRAGGPMIVITSATDRYAMDAFELGAADYLLKPYDPIRWKATMQRLKEKMKQLKPYRSAIRNLLIPGGDSIAVVRPDSILAIIKEEKNVIIHTKDGKSFTSKSTLQELEEKLSSFDFFRPHRSYLINLNEVAELIPWFNGAYNVKMKSASDMKVPVSRDAAKELLKRLGGE
ncbi:LytR/AlgR family response regulator transcription factor [Paenibacillus thermotolerans]|uniref:LytR/AlgR family response regulator transcription factor n=1 Tax=Paenibacillus thermotolerans TaxID=3027807 RepID=UPI0023689285|nr:MULTISPECIES: LytTR family DNA-binding domain-containing protein [unclassified Paenibacillus]